MTNPSADHSLRPHRAEWAAWAGVLLSLIAYGLIRLPCDDIAWHLATARLAFQQGAWPVVNSFSSAFADHTLFQQYPFFQTIVYGTYRVGGWPALSVLLCGLWLCAFLLFVEWSGDWRRAARLHLPWMIALVAMQRRMILRPDVLSVIWLACTLLVIDRYLRGRTRAIALLPLIHLLWVNSHQLFPLSLAVQAMLVGHLIAVRWPALRCDRRDRERPIGPAVAALAASIVLTACTPLGLRTLESVLHTGGSLAQHREHIRELARLWDRPFELTLAVLCAAPAVWTFWRTRRAWRPLEIGVWLMTLVLALAAVRGLVFFALVSIALFAKNAFETQTITATSRNRARLFASIHKLVSTNAAPLRIGAAALTLLLTANVLYHRWVSPPRILGGTEPGLGRSRGDWADGVMTFLRANPPPGRMLNLPWSLGDAIIWSLPEIKPLVDARFEAYPRAFMVRCAEASQSDATLTGLITEFHPTWILADHRARGVLDRVRSLLASGRWNPVYADCQTIVLVHDDDATRAYLRAHPFDPTTNEPADLLAMPRDLRELQQAAFARVVAALDAAANADGPLTRVLPANLK